MVSWRFSYGPHPRLDDGSLSVEGEVASRQQPALSRWLGVLSESATPGGKRGMVRGCPFYTMAVRQPRRSSAEFSAVTNAAP